MEQPGYRGAEKDRLRDDGQDKILCTVLHEAHRQQVKETMETLAEGSEGFYE